MKKIAILLSLALIAVLAYFLIKTNLRTIVIELLAIRPSAQTTEQQQTLAGLEVINSHPFYRMTYSGDYSQFLELKKKYYRAMGLPKPHCTSIAALNPSQEAVLGYNSDGEHRPLLLLFTHPSDGYASVSIVDIGETFSFTEQSTPFDSSTTCTVY